MEPIVALIANDITTESIPIENFNFVSNSRFKKLLIILNKNTLDANAEYKKLYPTKSLKIFGCGDAGLIQRILKLRKVLLLHKPSVIHTHHSISGFIAALITKLSYRTGQVITIHNDFRKYKLRQKIMFIGCILFADHIVCNSISTCNSLPNTIIKFINKKKKILVNYNGVNLENIKRLCYNSDKTNFTIGTVARLVKQKDIITLINGFSHFVRIERIDDAKLVIIGDGPSKRELQKKVADLNMTKYIFFTGMMQRKNVYHMLGSLDIFIVSSIWEGFCNAMVEAMVAGLPIVATNIKVLIEVLGSGNGLFFKVGDYKELSTKISTLYRNPSLRKKLGIMAKIHATNKYSLKDSAKKYTAIYNNSIEYSAS
jgi:glycosyltransferase involved in cell wall biosynthesis